MWVFLSGICLDNIKSLQMLIGGAALIAAAAGGWYYTQRFAHLIMVVNDVAKES